MKRLIVLGLIFTLALGIVLVPSASGGVCYPLEINKVAYGPAEDFTFEVWRDFNNNGVIDTGDVYVGQVVITGNGTATICVPWLGPYVVHEVLMAGSVYGEPPDEIGKPDKLPVYFYNERTTFPEVGQIEILKQDENGNALDGACFNITPDPRTCTGFLELCDNDANDKSPLDGVLLLTDCLVCCAVTVTETVAPAGYVLDPTPQQAHVTVAGETVTLTFENTPETCELIIRKVDESGNLLPGACFNITPDPRTGTGWLELCDGDANDECDGDDGVLCLSGLICGLDITVEETVVPDGYEGADRQTGTIPATLTFVNTRCELIIRKVDEGGNLLPGACFNITPDPRTGTGWLELCDGDANDECPADGVLCLSEVICGLDITVEETVAPSGGYQPGDPQTGTIPATLTFVNRREMDCGTVCAAQTQPGEFLFHDEQNNWFTWIYYYAGWGTEESPKEYPIYTGQTILCGTLYVYDKEVEPGVTHLFVNYVLTDTPTCTLGGLSVYHLQVDKSFEDLSKHVLNKPGEPVPGKCEYKDDFDPMVPSTGWIEADKKNDNMYGFTDPIYIFAHGVGCYFCL